MTDEERTKLQARAYQLVTGTSPEQLVLADELKKITAKLAEEIKERNTKEAK